MSDESEAALFALTTDLLKLDLPPACQEGVEANLRLLGTHARTLEAWLERQVLQP
jgi:hypothetical protein